MKDVKITIRVPRDLFENVKRYAENTITTLPALIEAYLRQLSAIDELAEAPNVRRLSGILSPDSSIQDYDEHLEEKYGE